MPLHENIGQTFRLSFSDITSALRNTITPPPGVSRLRGIINIAIVGIIAVLVLFPLMNMVPGLRRVIPGR